MVKNLHHEPFDEGTLTKLAIFEAYLKEWLPVFIQQSSPTIYIADLFAGPGKDKNGEPGSPIRLIETVYLYKESIQAKGLKVEVIFNELDTDKFTHLKRNLESVRDKMFYEPKFYNEDFIDLFDRLEPDWKEAPCLLFMDQNGIKQVTQDILKRMADLSRTDFIFFISSSYFIRFCDDPAFKKYFPDLNSDELKECEYNDIHRKILEHYRKLLSFESPMRMFPFSIKKGANIYGLIFGTKHILGADKFLDITWELNKINGEANFDIDKDLSKKEQKVLFAEFKQKTKLDEFDENLTEYISKKGVVSNKEIYDFAIDNGFTHKHAADVVKSLLKEKKIEKMFKSNGLFIGYKQCYREEKKVNFKWKE